MVQLDDMAIAKATEIDKELYKCLTKETLQEYSVVIYELEELEGNYIEEYEKKEREGGIKVNDFYRNYLNETEVPLHAFDLRTGVYGADYTAAGFYSAGIKYMDMKNYDQAIVNFDKAKKIWPRHIGAYLEKAKCHYVKEEYWYAVCEAWNAVILNPLKIAERDEKSRAVLELLTPDTIAAFEKFLADSLYFRGVSFWNIKDYDEALVDYNEVIKHDPARMAAYHARLMVLMEFRDYENALLDCEKLLAEHYHELYAIQCRGIAYNNLEKLDEAMADFNTSLSMNPDEAIMYAHRANCYYKKKEYRQAIPDASEAIRRGYTEAFFDRGIAYSALGEYDKAIADFDEIIRLDSENDFAVYQREKAVTLKAQSQN
jgi:tetratricopeptide (TPR) repeat protein